MTAQVDLAQLEEKLERLAAECITIGTPFAVRRAIKDVIRLLPRISSERERKA